MYDIIMMYISMMFHNLKKNSRTDGYVRDKL